MQVINANILSLLSQSIEAQALIFTKKIAEKVRDIPQLLKNVRLVKGKSQEGVAETLGISLASYGRYERGQTQISFSDVVKLVEFYGLSLDEFLHFGEPKYIVQEPETDYEKMKTENEELRRQLDIANELNDSNRRLLKVYQGGKSGTGSIKQKK